MDTSYPIGIETKIRNLLKRFLKVVFISIAFVVPLPILIMRLIYFWFAKDMSFFLPTTYRSLLKDYADDDDGAYIGMSIIFWLIAIFGGWFAYTVYFIHH